jgi:hypothetical protein
VPDLWLSVVSPHPDGFELVSGDVGSPVILHVPHASSTIPAYIRAGIVLDDAALAAELATMTDAHTDRIALAAAARVSRARGCSSTGSRDSSSTPSGSPTIVKRCARSAWVRSIPHVRRLGAPRADARPKG